MGVCLLVWVWGQKCDFFFWSKMSINEPKMFINYFFKMSINKTPSGVGLAHENSHENLNRMYYLLLIT